MQTPRPVTAGALRGRQPGRCSGGSDQATATAWNADLKHLVGDRLDHRPGSLAGGGLETVPPGESTLLPGFRAGKSAAPRPRAARSASPCTPSLYRPRNRVMARSAAGRAGKCLIAFRFSGMISRPCGVQSSRLRSSSASRRLSSASRWRAARSLAASPLATPCSTVSACWRAAPSSSAARRSRAASSAWIWAWMRSRSASCRARTASCRLASTSSWLRWRSSSTSSRRLRSVRAAISAVSTRHCAICRADARWLLRAASSDASA